MRNSKNERLLNRRNFLKTTANKISGTMLGCSILSNFACKSSVIEMPKQVLGRTNLSVSLLGFGCTQVKDQAAYQRASEPGINYFHIPNQHD